MKKIFAVAALATVLLTTGCGEVDRRMKEQEVKQAQIVAPTNLWVSDGTTAEFITITLPDGRDVGCIRVSAGFGEPLTCDEDFLPTDTQVAKPAPTKVNP